jgi:hypothetical protein
MGKINGEVPLELEMDSMSGPYLARTSSNSSWVMLSGATASDAMTVLLAGSETASVLLSISRDFEI